MGQHRTNKPKRKQLRKRARRDARVDEQWVKFCRDNNIDPSEDTEDTEESVKHTKGWLDA